MLYFPTGRALLKKVTVSADIFDQDATTEVQHKFQIEKLFREKEASFSFPLDSFAAIYDFETSFLNKKGRMLKNLLGEAKEKEEARE
eukprot:snap_masked-scaffold_20-processed-gene-1.17-mRNA-1 protein AED:1.00 eAED:1.00 QI:0/-1/0/0/-1/1/1/0/86